nr:uncharacterized protein LOC109162418 [Ipomoea batatas]
MVKDVWCRSGLAIGNTYQGCFAGWLNGIFMRFTKDQLCMVAAVLMALWHARNVALWDGFVTRPDSIWRGAVAALQQWQLSNDTKGTGGVSHAVSAPHAIDNVRLEPPVLEPDWNHPSKVPVPVSAILEPRTSGSKSEPNLGHAYPISGSWCDF